MKQDQSTDIIAIGASRILLMENLKNICSRFSRGDNLIAALEKEEVGNAGIGERLSVPLVAILREAAGLSLELNSF